VSFQTFLVHCRKKHDRAYIMVSLAGLWIIPAIMGVYVLWPWMLTIWSVFTLTVGHIMFLATRRELASNTPRLVYAFFSTATRSCFALGVVGYGLMLTDFFRIENIVGLNNVVGPLGGALLCYGLYLGVLSRDCASLCADSMASRMGYRSNDEEDRRELPPTICCVCGGHLDPGSGGDEVRGGDMDGEAEIIENPFDGCLGRQAAECIVTLDCGHRYHESCIRGWTLIGKKDTCAYCNERVELKQVFPWERHSLLWVQLLDGIRYLIVWNPLIILVVQALLPLIGAGGGGSIGGY